MSELTIRDYKNTFRRFLLQSSNSVQIDVLKKELLAFLIDFDLSLNKS